MRSPASLVLLLPLLLASVQAAPLAQNGLVLVTREGSSVVSNYVVADSSDAGAANIWNKIKDDPQVKRATAYYQQAQELRVERIRKELSADGDFSAADRQILEDLPGPFPVYIEVRAGTGGAFNDWKGQFTLDYGNGKSETIAAPRIVFQANDPVAVSSPTALLQQTVVHEIGHGFHAMVVGQQSTPSTPWLSRPHAGNSTTDGTLALIEGYAEFVGAYLTSRKTIAGDPADAIPNNLYVYDSAGEVKSAEDLWKTEGWAATVLYKMASSGQIDDAFNKINQTLAENNPRTFQELIEGFQTRYPEDSAAVKSTLSTLSRNQIYPGATLPTGNQPTPTTVYADNFDDLGDVTWEDGDSEGGLGKWAQIATMIGGGALGAVFGLSFGPVGILIAAAAGTGIGHLIGKLLFDQDQAAKSWEYGGWAAAPGHSSGSKMTVGETPAAPIEGLDPELARLELDRSYRMYRQILSQSGSDESALEAQEARQAYEAALASYRRSLHQN